MIGAQKVKGNLPKNNVAKIFDKKQQDLTQSKQTESNKGPDQESEDISEQNN